MHKRYADNTLDSATENNLYIGPLTVRNSQRIKCVAYRPMTFIVKTNKHKYQIKLGKYDEIIDNIGFDS